MATDKVTKPQDYGPVIASSNRGADVEPYARRIYNQEPHAWRDVLPKEWINGGKAEEQAMVRKFFTEREIYLQGGDENGFRFLKQVWLWNAHWNLNMKIPAIVDQWFSDPDMITMLQDEKYGRPAVMGPDPLPKTVFDAEKVEMYGEKLLKEAIRCIQYRVQEMDRAKESKSADALVDNRAGRRSANLDGISPTDTNPYASTAQISPVQPTALPKNDGTMTEPTAKSATAGFFGGAQSSTIPKASPADFGLAENSLQRVVTHPPYAGAGFQRRPRAGSAKENYAPQHSIFAGNENIMSGNNHGQQPFSRKRGHSFNKNQNNHRNFSGPRHDSQQACPRFEPSYQQPPNLAGPGQVVNDGRNPQFQSMPDSFRMPFNGQQNFMPPTMGMHHQQMQGPNNLQLGVQPEVYAMPPPGFDAHIQPGFAQPQVGQHFNFPPNQKGIQAAPFPLFDRVNDRFNENRFGGETLYEDHSSRRGRGRRESNVSRGARTRGYNNGGRGGRVSRGRNSFSGPRQHEDGSDERQIWSRKQSIDLNEQHGDGGYRDRRNSVVSHNWRANTDPSTSDVGENVPPGRVFSGPGFPAHSSQPFGSAPNGPSSAPKAFDAAGPAPRHSSGQFQPNFERGTIVTDFFHDEKDPRMSLYPGKLITSTRIGVEAGHVRKLVALGVPGNLSDNDVAIFFGSRGHLVVQVGGPPPRLAASYADGSTRLVYIIFHTHLAAMEALNLRGEYWGPGLGRVKLEVPKEYWDVSFARYPGQFYDQQPREGNYPVRDESSHGPVDQPPPFAAAQSVQPGAAGQAKEHGSPGGRVHTAPPSDNGTPTASGTSTPKKKDKKRRSPKEPRQQKLTESGLDVKPDHSDASSASKDPELASPTGSPANDTDASGCHVKATAGEGEEVSPKSRHHMRAKIGDSGKAAVNGASENKVSTAGEDNSPSNNNFGQTSAIEHDGPSRAHNVTTTLADNSPTDIARTREASSHQEAFRASPTQPAESANASTGNAAPASIHEAQTGSSGEGVKSTDDSAADTAASSGCAADTHKARISAEASTLTSGLTEPADRPDSVVRDKPKELVEESCTEAATGGIASPTKSECTTISEQSPKDIRKAQSPVPKVKFTESLKIDNDGSASHDQLQRTTSGTAVPPTPGFVTAPSTPVEGIGNMDTKSDVAQQPEKLVVEQPQKKVEKVKGPATTESLSMFGKKKQAKPQKPKAQKGKGSIKGKSKDLDDDGSTVPSDSLPPSGVNTPSPPSANEQKSSRGEVPPEDAEQRVNAGIAGEEASRKTDLAGSENSSAKDMGSLTSESAAPEQHRQAVTSPKQSRDSSPSKGIKDTLKDWAKAAVGFGQPNTNLASEVKSEKSSPVPKMMIKRPSTVSGEMLKGNRGARDMDDPDTHAGNAAVPPVANPPSTPRSGKGNHSKSQPFQGLSTGGDGRDVTDSGHSGGSDQSRDAPPGSGPDDARGVAVNPALGDSEGRKKKKKKKKSKAKNKASGASDEKEEEADKNVAPDPADQQKTPQNIQSDIISEDSSHTLGRSGPNSPQTPSSTAAASVRSPPRTDGIPHTHDDSRTVGIPSRRRPQNVPQEELDRISPRHTHFWVEESESSDDEPGQQFDSMIDSAKTYSISRNAMRLDAPTVFFYVGPGKKEDQERERAEKKTEQQKLEEGLQKRFGVGKKEDAAKE